MIDTIVIDSGEIPRLAFHQRGRDRVDGSPLSQSTFANRNQPLVLLLIDLGRVGNKGQNMRLGQFVRENLESRQLRPVLGRVDCSFRNLQPSADRTSTPAKRIGHDVPLIGSAG